MEYIVAPYTAWAQLVYLERHSKAYIHASYGSAELLMFDTAERVITSIDLEKGTFSWLSKRAILADLNITDDQFVDVCILCGFELCITFPPLVSDVGFTFAATVDLVRRYKSGFNAANGYADHPGVVQTKYIDLSTRTRSAIKYHMILTSDGSVQPLNANDAPTDIHEFIGYRLPEEVYFYLSKGLIGPQVINNLVSGVLIETAPLCGGETKEYRQFLEGGMHETRGLALGLLTNPLHSFYQSRKVVTFYWFDPQSERVMSHEVTSEIKERMKKWNVKYSLIEEELRRQVSQTIDIAFCLSATSEQGAGAKTSMTKKEGSTLEKKDEVVCNILWRLLDLRGFITPGHTNSSWGEAFLKAHAACRPNDKLQEPIFVGLELVRYGVLNAKFYSRVYSGGPTFGTDEEKAHQLLIMRVMSLVPMKFKSAQFSGPLARELLAFNSFVKSYNRTMRNLVEMVALGAFLCNDIRKSRDDYLNISLSLPFNSDVNTALGIVAKLYLDTVISLSAQAENKEAPFGMSTLESASEPTESIKESALGSIKDAFTACVDPVSDLGRGFRLWDALVAGVGSVDELSKEQKQEFSDADAWLKTYRL